jgi:hypothetical protein
MFFPEIERGVEEGDAVTWRLGGDFSDGADFGFAKGDQGAEGHLLFGNEFVSRENTGAVKTEDDGVNFFGEDAAPSASQPSKMMGVDLVMRPL